MKDKTTEQKIIKPHEGFQQHFSSANVDIVFGAGGVGNGKEAPLTSLVLTPYGWRKMGEIVVGSEVVTPFDGNAKVTAVFPQGVKDVYELRTRDGRVARCGLEHLWMVRTDKQLERLRKDGKWQHNFVLTTQEVKNQIEKGKKLFIPLCGELEFEEKEYVIPPYVMGVLLGDGCIANVKSRNHITISNAEDDIIEKVGEIVGATNIKLYRTNYNVDYFFPKIYTYWAYLNEKGLNTYSYNKFIPEEYLFGSIKQRRELLAGLFDTDGCVEKTKNRLHYDTTSPRLRDDVIALCRSLGYRATYTTDNRSEKFTNGANYTVHIHTSDKIFTSKKHHERFNEEYEKNKKQIKYADHTEIMSIKKVGREECQCIMVDDEKHLYITDDYTVTHNSYSLVLAIAEPLMKDPDFRALITRKSLQNQKQGGGFVDTFNAIFGDGDLCHIKQSDSPRISFASGAYCDLTYLDDTNLDRLKERAKGWQYDFIAIDELTEMPWEVFTYMLTRNRGRSKTFTGKFFASYNPKRTHWSRVFCDWYIGADGYVIPERNGHVRYFFQPGDSVKDVVFGDSPEEVYSQCRIQIDRKIKPLNENGGSFTYKDFIKSFVLYVSTVAENKSLISSNSGYVGSVSVAGDKVSSQLLGVNFNIDPDEDEKIPVPAQKANECFTNDPAVNGDKWITCDLADYGTDNVIMLAWNGFHIYDIKIITHSTPRENAMNLRGFAALHGVPDTHIIFDATAARYVLDYIPDAVPFLSNSTPRGLYKDTGVMMKDICYRRLQYMIGRGQLTFDDKVARRTYTHQEMKYPITIQNEFIEECSVVRYDTVQSGKLRLWAKKKMNQMLGKNRSMDLLDPCAMRMYPCLDIEYGSELNAGREQQDESMYIDPETAIFETQNIYDDNFWY